MKTLNQAMNRPKSAGTSYVAGLEGLLSPIQLKFIKDPSRFKIAASGRRAGKSYCIAAYLLINCLTKSNTKALYTGMTRSSAKETIWPILTGFLARLNIPHTVEIASLSIRLDNGSAIQVIGADMSGMRARLRGQKFSLVAIDETAFYSGLGELVETLLPALADDAGSLVMTSSPGLSLTGFFYEAYAGTQMSSWSQHHWTLLDNPHFQRPAADPKFTTAGEEELATICRLQFQNDLDAPAFIREYHGRYVKDATYMVYPVADETRLVVPMVAPKVSLAIALGPDGTFGAVTMEHSEYSRYVNILNSFVGSFSRTEDVEILRTWYEYSQYRLVDTQVFTEKAVQEISKRFDMAFSIVALKDRPFFQYLMRQDLVDKYVRIKKDLPILNEYAIIVRDAEGVEKPDADGSPRLMANAALALYHRIYTAFLKDWAPPPTDEEIMIKQLEASARQEKEDANVDRDDGY